MLTMKGYEVKFNIYAENDVEARQLQSEIVGFINYHAERGRAVTARKVASALSRWKDNVIIRNRIISYFEEKE